MDAIFSNGPKKRKNRGKATAAMRKKATREQKKLAKAKKLRAMGVALAPAILKREKKEKEKKRAKRQRKQKARGGAAGAAAGGGRKKKKRKTEEKGEEEEEEEEDAEMLELDKVASRAASGGAEDEALPAVSVPAHVLAMFAPSSSSSSSSSSAAATAAAAAASTAPSSSSPGSVISRTRNAYVREYLACMKKFPEEMKRMFDPQITDERRLQLFDLLEASADVADRYAWAIPDRRALRILAEFAPIVEIGCGRGYWGELLLSAGVDYVGYDKDVDGEHVRKHVQQGGPEKLAEHQDRTLLLCYPDDFVDSEESLALACFQQFEGTYIIHVGELLGQTLIGDNPWGRTSDAVFQQELSNAFHCILRVPLPSWPVSLDTLTVWKRTETVTVDDDVYKFIPASERLSQVACCQATKHLTKRS